MCLVKLFETLLYLTQSNRLLAYSNSAFIADCSFPIILFFSLRNDLFTFYCSVVDVQNYKGDYNATF